MAGESQQPPSTSPDPTTTEQMLRAVAAERDFVEGKIAVLEQRLAGMDEATRVLSKTVNEFPTDVDVAVGHLKALIERQFDGLDRVLDEQRRGLEIAEREREKAASALREEQRLGSETAEREREKAAAALRDELARAISEGDRNLRDHIQAQVAEIRAALVASDLLEQERMGRATDRVEAERRISELTREMGETAILKAERASDKRFDEFARVITTQVNNLRDATTSMTERLASKL